MIFTAKDLRFHSKELIDAALRGEEVIITYRGKPTAKIVPIEYKIDNTSGNDELFGMWKDNAMAKDPENYVREKRRGRKLC